MSTGQVLGFALIGTYSPDGDEGLPPFLNLVVNPTSTSPLAPITLLWTSFNVQNVRITASAATPVVDSSTNGIISYSTAYTTSVTIPLGESAHVGDTLVLMTNFEIAGITTVQVTGVTDSDGNVWTQVGAPTGYPNNPYAMPSGYVTMQMWQAVNKTLISAGGTLALTLTVNTASTAGTGFVGFASIFGLGNVGTPVYASSGGAPSSPATGTIAPTTDGEFLLFLYSAGGYTSLNAGLFTSLTNFGIVSGGEQASGAYYVAPVLGPYTASADITSVPSYDGSGLGFASSSTAVTTTSVTLSQANDIGFFILGWAPNLRTWVQNAPWNIDNTITVPPTGGTPEYLVFMSANGLSATTYTGSGTLSDVTEWSAAAAFFSPSGGPTPTVLQTASGTTGLSVTMSSIAITFSSPVTVGNLIVIEAYNDNGRAAVITDSQQTYSLTAAANAVGGNTSYTGTFSSVPSTGSSVYITGFLTNANNGFFTVQAGGSDTTLIVNNASGAAETDPATAAVIYSVAVAESSGGVGSETVGIYYIVATQTGTLTVNVGNFSGVSPQPTHIAAEAYVVQGTGANWTTLTVGFQPLTAYDSGYLPSSVGSGFIAVPGGFTTNTTFTAEAYGIAPGYAPIIVNGVPLTSEALLTIT